MCVLFFDYYQKMASKHERNLFILFSNHNVHRLCFTKYDCVNLIIFIEHMANCIWYYYTETGITSLIDITWPYFIIFMSYEYCIALKWLKKAIDIIRLKPENRDHPNVAPLLSLLFFTCFLRLLFLVFYFLIHSNRLGETISSHRSWKSELRSVFDCDFSSHGHHGSRFSHRILLYCI